VQEDGASDSELQCLGFGTETAELIALCDRGFCLLVEVFELNRSVRKLLRQC